MEDKRTKIKIAITGGIGSGKSQAANFIKALGFPVFSCDEIYKEIILSQEYISQVEKAFPECVAKNQIDRKSLAQIIFADENRRKQLNSIAHPMIMDKLSKDMENAEAKLVFAEVPLLFESGYKNAFDLIFVIQRGLSQRIESVKNRDGLSEDEILQRIKSQFDYSKIDVLKNSQSKIILVDNNGSKEDLKTSIYQAVIKLL